MTGKSNLAIACLLLICTSVTAQEVKLGSHLLVAHQISLKKVKLNGESVIRVVKDSTIKKFDEPTFAKIVGTEFSNGTIEVKVFSRILAGAPELARGFLGIAYHINSDNSVYESIYIRPLNGRVNDQVRRNHSIQYYAYPDWKFDRLRKEQPERYETYADMELGKWITLKIVVFQGQSKLYLDGREQPSLVVAPLKDVNLTSGGIGLWTEIGTEAFFKDLKITHQN